MIARLLWCAAAVLLVFPLGVVVPAAGAGASEGAVTGAPPVNLVVDTSGSMRGSRLDQAKSALHTSIDALTDGQAAGLRSYAGGCSDGGILRVPVGLSNRQQLHDETKGLTAGGGTPTPAALRAAAEDLPEGPGVVVLISDGQSTCGDPCPVAEELADLHGIDFTVHTVGFHAPGAAEGELACVADATGGKYYSTDDADGLADAIGNAIGRKALGQFVVMGDSFTSGEGTENYDEDSGRCHRSEYAWANFLAAISETGELVANLACSGAVIDDTLKSRRWGEEPQLEQLRDLVDQGQPIDTVMFTIGGNDLGFRDILYACWLKDFGKRDPRKEPCNHNKVLREPHKHIEEVMQKIQTKILPKLREVVGDDTTIIMVGYPRLVPDRYEDVNNCGWMTEDDHDALRNAQTILQIHGFWFAEDTDAHFVPSLNALAGHELCSEDSFFYPVAARHHGWRGEDGQQQGHPRTLGYIRWARWIADELAL